IRDWQVPELPGLRVDAGVELGSEISIHYDPMIAKLVTHAPTRGEAVALMRRALAELSCRGVTTNRDFLRRVLGHPAFAAGDFDTHFLDDRAAELTPQQPPPELVAEAAIACALAGHEERRGRRAILPALEPGFRN